MSAVVYTLFEDTGKFRSYCTDEEQKSDELLGGIWKEIFIYEWYINYSSNLLFPSLDVPTDVISWISRPTNGK